MPNRLATESSPYLQQHANNPVAWYPWGEEALQKARDEDKPIFLSIGYSSCHWCHVMEHESFEDEGIARILNDNFISIKVDREERPDLDQIYMNAVLALRNGQGGWPLSAFLTPNQDVFFGGTYWPPQSRMGMPGFDHVLMSVLDAFQNRRDAVNDQSRQISAWLNRETEPVEGDLNEDLLLEAAHVLERQFDFQHGGFGTAPKFPHAMDLALLIRLSDRWGPEHDPSSTRLMEMVRLNLAKMARGGIYDHLSGGFARYSVDEHWLVPHFEKMLYDNALLAGAYLDMFHSSQEPVFGRVARETLDYLLNYMTDEAGAFYSTEDADSEGEEGKFYVWSRAEIESLLSPEIAELFCELYGVTIAGNFEGANILHLRIPVESFADQKGIELGELHAMMDSARETLLRARDQRVRPGLDDKVLVSWNALAIGSFARASYILSDTKYYQAAAKAADFILQNLRTEDGRLLHTWRLGVAKLNAYLDDYSCFIDALLQLYRASFDEKWVDVAVELAGHLTDYFGSEDGGFYFTPSDHETLIARTKEYQDSSVPSGNSMAACALIQLGRLTGNIELVQKAEAIAKDALSLMKRSPLASGQMLIAVEQLLTTSSELVLVGLSSEPFDPLGQLVRQQAPANCSLIARSTEQKNGSRWLDAVLEGKQAIEQQPTLYICQGFSCQTPIVGTEAILQAVKDL